MQKLPTGITGFDHMPYGYRRWNGSIWANIQVDAYNRKIDNIRRYYESGYDVSCQIEIDNLYNLAQSFDYAGVN